MFGIIETKSKKWLCGTDYRFYEPRQRLKGIPITYNTREEAEADLIKRKCGKYYEVREI